MKGADLVVDLVVPIISRGLVLSVPPTFFSVVSSPLISSLFSSLKTMASNMEVFCEILIAILLPPLGVCLKRGCCTLEFLICLVLTILGYIPGIIYALYVIVFQNREGSHELSAPLNSA